jgi:hypothetical protein
MRTVATAFSVEMRRVDEFVDIIVSLFYLSKQTLTHVRARRVLLSAITDIYTKTKAIRLGDSLAFEGAFLTACALFEEAIRNMVETAALQIAAKKPSYTDLPDKMREEQFQGCVDILRSRGQDKYRHLPPGTILSSMATCESLFGATTYSLTVEALSGHTNNFRADVLKDTVGRLGIKELWPKLSNETRLQSLFGTTTAADAQNFSVARLNAIMGQRNGIIHRSVSFAPPTAKDVKECAAFFETLVDSLANVLVAYVAIV